MSGHDSNRSRGMVRTLIDNSFLLIAGSVAALIWANVAASRGSDSYQRFVEFDFASVFSTHHEPTGTHAVDLQASSQSSEPLHQDHGRKEISADFSLNAPELNPETSTPAISLVPVEFVAKPEPAQANKPTSDAVEAAHADEAHSGGHHGFTLHFLVNDIFMALFFAIAAKEVWESLLPGGALSNPRKAATPLLATFGGIAGPVAVYLGMAFFMGRGVFADFGNGWAVPCATDIAFSYLIAKFIFGSSHPAIAFLLLLAIADDAAGLVILAIFYPQAPIVPAWLMLTFIAIVLAGRLQMWKVHNHWAYLIGPGVLSWVSFYQANIHPALGLVPIIPFLPHAHTDLGLFAKEELDRHDTLNEFEHFWKLPVECFLGLFGLVNAGVVMSSVGAGTWLVLAGLMIGKPLGITGMTLVAEKAFGLEKPAGMTYRHVVTLGMVAAIGFTVALFVSVAAFRVPGSIQDSVKMGALLSFAAAPVAVIMARLLGIKAWKDNEAKEPQQAAHAAGAPGLAGGASIPTA